MSSETERANLRFIKDYVTCHGTAPTHTSTYSRGTFPEDQPWDFDVWRDQFRIKVLQMSEDEELVFKARGKRVRAAADVKAGDSEDTSPRGPIDASQADSPPKSSDDEAGEDEAGLPGKKRLKLRTKGAAEAAKAAGFARQEGDSELEDEGAPEEEEEDAFYGYAEDDEEAAL